MPKEWLQKMEKIEWAQFYADSYSDIGLRMIASKLEKTDTFLQENSERQNVLQKHIQRIRSKDFYLRAEHLQAEGIPPGIKMGELLEEAMRIAVNEEIENPKEILQRLKQTPLWD